MSEGVHNIDRSLVGATNLYSPRQPEGLANETTSSSSTSQPRSTKRKRGDDDSVDFSSIRLQTSDLNTPKAHRAYNALDHEENLSPRSVVSARFQSLNLKNLETTQEMPMTGTRTKRRTSWTVPVHMSIPAPGESEEQLRKDLDRLLSSEAADELATEGLRENSSRNGPSDTAASDAPTVYQPSSDQADHDAKHATYRFSAGGQSAVTAVSSERVSTDHGLPTLSEVKSPPRLPSPGDYDTPVSSPSKRRRHRSASRSPALSPLLKPAQGRQDEPKSTFTALVSDSKRRLSSPSPPPKKDQSDSSFASESDGEGTTLWWQDSEIVGHDPADPDDDSRGVNGIGYQKTKAEQYRISERKKRQITEWRNREAREARALRAVGRGSGSGYRSSREVVDKADKGHRVMLGRVTKSRSGSPVEKRIEEIEARSTPKKGVRFEEA